MPVVFPRKPIVTQVFLEILWMPGEQAKRNWLLWTVLALSLLGTSLAVALSPGIHSILVHIRIG